MTRGHTFICLLPLLIGCSSQSCEKETDCPKENQYVFGKEVSQIPVSLKAGVTEVFFVESNITVIPKGAFATNPSLEKIEFITTPTVSIENGAFEGLVKLKHIEISSTPLTSLSVDVFQDLHNLEELLLKLNKIRSLEKGLFDGLKKLRELQLHINEIDTIEEGCLMTLKTFRSSIWPKNTYVRWPLPCSQSCTNCRD